MRFRLVDRILSWKAHDCIEGLKAVSFEEASAMGELGRPAACPRSLMVEAMFQAANWLIMLSTRFEKLGLIVACRRIEVVRALSLGERMNVRVRWVSSREGAALFEGEGRVGEELVLRGTGCMAHLDDLERYCKAADLRVLFEEIAPTCALPHEEGIPACPKPTAEA